MEGKYYIPSIEEFHVGFEYQVNSGGFDDIWNSEIIYAEFDNGTWKSNIDHVVSTFKDGCDNYRVKYLDKEDIEALGFKVGGLPWQYFDGIHKLVILKHNMISIEHEADECYLFYGEIFNKSEFKKLLKQLKIINE